jgi:hypothetical protein
MPFPHCPKYLSSKYLSSDYLVQIDGPEISGCLRIGWLEPRFLILSSTLPSTPSGAQARGFSAWEIEMKYCSLVLIEIRQKHHKQGGDR